MVIRITDRCLGKCTHCMDDARPDGAHMPMETFEKAANFLVRIRDAYWIISGGEPTMHPQIIEILKYAKARNSFSLTMASNGHFLKNETLTADLLALNINIQVTYDPRYYPVPIQVNKAMRRKISFYPVIQQIYPQGRAVINDLECSAKAPKCFNLRSLAQKMPTLTACVQALNTRDRYCTPSINIDGSISAGESRLCSIIGHVEMAQHDIMENLRNLKCDQCGLIREMAPEYQKAILMYQ